MKLKTTKSAIKNNYYTIIKIGYCDAQFLLQYISPFGYSTRAEGWACDYYDVDGICISTGYSPLENKNAITNYQTTHDYDNRAKMIVCGNEDYEVKKEKVYALLKNFISQCKKQCAKEFVWI